MHFLDTHIVVWLYQKSLELLSANAKQAIEDNDIFISPIVSLELEYLYEIGRLRTGSQEIVKYLQEKIGLKVDGGEFHQIVNTAVQEKWTRDPFDRLIVSHAKYRDAHLVSKDGKILEHYSKTVF
jgi:PIN domain nuclease of toxin-antitoxin system